MDIYDEVSLLYWKEKSKGGNKKFECIHNGVVYKNGMNCTKVEFVYKYNGKEFFFSKESDDAGKDIANTAYIKMVEKACNQSDKTLNNYRNAKLKYRVYTENERNGLTNKLSARVDSENSAIIIHGEKYYVGNNLNLSEYFETASKHIEESELSKWFIRVYLKQDDIKNLKDKDEEESVDIHLDEVQLTIKATLDKKDNHVNHGSKKSSVKKINFSSINKEKKKVGDIGEEIVFLYEKKRLEEIGRKDLADSVIHSAKDEGDGLGYDIQSYNADGSVLYIEVKTTKQNMFDRFYLSNKEKRIAKEMYLKGDKYLIYRIYNLNLNNGTGDLVIYSPPFDDEHYDMIPENWRVCIKK